MPTGYTSKIYEGKDTSFKEFVLGCAKAFGALITMRDEPSSTPIPEEFKPDTYHKERISETEKKLENLKSMTLAECEIEVQKEFDKSMKEKEERIREALQLKARYEDMLNKVNLWEPPTKDHEGLKKFMIEQLQSSIKFDCSTDYFNEMKPKKLTGEHWKTNKINQALKDLIYYTKENSEEIERVNNRNKWIKELRGSLK